MIISKRQRRTSASVPSYVGKARAPAHEFVTWADWNAGPVVTFLFCMALVFFMIPSTWGSAGFAFGSLGLITGLKGW